MSGVIGAIWRSKSSGFDGAVLAAMALEGIAPAARDSRMAKADTAGRIAECDFIWVGWSRLCVILAP